MTGLRDTRYAETCAEIQRDANHVCIIHPRTPEFRTALALLEGNIAKLRLLEDRS